MKTGGIQELKTCLQLAKELHQGQLRAIGSDLGKPYFDTHIVRVVNAVPQRSKPAAALHDALEDTVLTPDELDRLVWKDAVARETAAAVKLLTRVSEIDYPNYIDEIVKDESIVGEIAREVKLADLSDNLSTCPEGSLRNRYIKAIAEISAAMR